MQVKGVRKLRDLKLSISSLSPDAQRRLAERIGDLVIVDVQKRYTDNVGIAISKAYSAYLLAVADYLGRKGDSAFKLPYNISTHRRLKKARRGAVTERVNPIPERGPASTVQISFSIPVPIGTTAKSLLDETKYRQEGIEFTTVFAGLAKSTIEKKLQYGVHRHWRRTGNTLREIGNELRGIARSSPARVANVRRRRIPIQPDLRPKAAKPFARYSIVVSVRLKGPRDPAWAEMLTESFAAGIKRSGFGSVRAFGATPYVRSIFNETGFTTRTGLAVPARAFIQEMGVRAGRALFQQLQQVNS